MKITTDKQKALLNFIKEYQEEHNVRPTYELMATHFEISKSAIQQRIEALNRKGLLELKNIYII